MLQLHTFNNYKIAQHDLDQTGCAVLQLDNEERIVVSLYSKQIVQEAYEYLDLFPKSKINLVLETLNHRELNRTLAHLRVSKSKGFLSKTAMEELRSGYSTVASPYIEDVITSRVCEYFYK